MVETIRDWIGLSLVHGVGPALFYQLISRFGSPSEVLNRAALVIREVDRPRVGSLEQLIDAGRLRQRAEAELRALQKVGGRVLIRDDAEYPELLGHIGQPPPVIYLYGNSALLEMMNVHICEENPQPAAAPVTASASEAGHAQGEPALFDVVHGALELGLESFFSRVDDDLRPFVVRPGAVRADGAALFPRH